MGSRVILEMEIKLFVVAIILAVVASPLLLTEVRIDNFSLPFR